MQPESSSVKLSSNKGNIANDDSVDQRKGEEKMDPSFGQFQDTGVEAENNEVKDANTGHKNQSVDVEGPNGNYDFGLWENRNPKEMPADDLLEEDDNGIKVNKTSLALPSLQAFQENPNQIPKIAEVSAVNPLTQSGNKTVNYDMESIRRPQLPTKKSMAPLLQKMMRMDTFKQENPKESVGNQEINSDINVNVLNKPLNYQEVVQEEQNIEAPNTPDKKIINAPALNEEHDVRKPNEPIVHKVMPFDEVFNNHVGI